MQLVMPLVYVHYLLLPLCVDLWLCWIKATESNDALIQINTHPTLFF